MSGAKQGIFSTLNRLKSRGMDFGISRTRSILDKLSSPDKRLRIIHIAGTNGKGSTAEYFTSILVAAGKRVGTFCSPEVYDYYDQFGIDNKPIEKSKFEKCFFRASAAEEGATSFEVETAAAILAFCEEGCEYAVIECGMGGLNDATNAIVKKELAVITSVSLEHTAYLGKTLTEIAEQKAGIIKNCKTVVNAYQEQEVKDYFSSLNVLYPEPVAIKQNSFFYDGEEYKLKARGCLQPYNAATAIEGAKLLGIEPGYIKQGIENAAPLGRIQYIREGNKTYILDGAHNPAAFVSLVDELKEIKATKTLIYGSLSDKDMESILKMLSQVSKDITAVKCPSARAADLKLTVGLCKKYFEEVESAEDIETALESANGEYVIVCGSFTLLKGAKKWIERKL